MAHLRRQHPHQGKSSHGQGARRSSRQGQRAWCERLRWSRLSRGDALVKRARCGTAIPAPNDRIASAGAGCCAAHHAACDGASDVLQHEGSVGGGEEAGGADGGADGAVAHHVDICAAASLRLRKKTQRERLHLHVSRNHSWNVWPWTTVVEEWFQM